MAAPVEGHTRTPLLRVVCLCVLAYLLMFSYAIARPSAESLFLDAHDYSQLPRVWILVAFAALATVAVYNRFSSRYDLVTLYAAVCLISGAMMTGLVFAWKAGLPGTSYVLYVWKDIYIVVLVEIFYSFANAVFPIQRARWYYGLFGVFGSIGGISGNLAVGPLAHRVGTDDSLWAVLPALGLSAVLCVAFARVIGARSLMREEKTDDGPPKLSQGLAILRSSSYLLLMLGLVAVVQVAITLIDYQFNGIVEATYPDTDTRTGVIGKVYAAVNTGTLLGHALVGPLLRLLAIPGTLLAVPLALAGTVIAFAINPAFGTMAAAKVASKAFDYTIFRAAKELLYIPLSYVEKTQGKAVVDMLTYRVAKGGASLLLLILAAVVTQALVTGLTLAAIVVWIAITVAIAVRFRKRVSREQEMKGHTK